MNEPTELREPSVAEILTAMNAQFSAIQDSFARAFAEQKLEIKTLREEIEAIRTKSAVSPQPVILTPPESNQQDPTVVGAEYTNGSNNVTSDTHLRPPSTSPVTRSHQITHPNRAEPKQLSERLPDPPAFTGKRERLREFTYHLNNKLVGNADRYQEDEQKLRYALSRLSGDAASLVHPFQPQSLEALLAILEASYGDPNQQATAQRKLQQLKQGRDSFPAYFSKFHRFAKESGWNDTALISRLIESLNEELRKSLIGIDLPDNLEQCANIINKLYNDILRLSTNPRYTKPLYRATGTSSAQKDPDAMDLDAVQSRDECLRKGLCFDCGKPGHRAHECEEPKQTKRSKSKRSKSRGRKRSRSRNKTKKTLATVNKQQPSNESKSSPRSRDSSSSTDDSRSTRRSKEKSRD